MSRDDCDLAADVSKLRRYCAGNVSKVSMMPGYAGRFAMMYSADAGAVSVRFECCRMLTNVGTVNGGTGGLEAKTDILVPSAVAGGLASSLGVLEDGLLLESLFGLDTELNVRHDGRMYGEEGVVRWRSERS